MFDNYLTVCSAFLFFITLCVDNCPQSHPTILVLIASSLIYKYNYLFYPQHTNILSLTTVNNLIIILI